jgi:hypothetical protein
MTRLMLLVCRKSVSSKCRRVASFTTRPHHKLGRNPRYSLVRNTGWVPESVSTRSERFFFDPADNRHTEICPPTSRIYVPYLISPKSVRFVGALELLQHYTLTLLNCCAEPLIIWMNSTYNGSVRYPLAYYSNLKMEPIYFSETSVGFQRTTRRYILEDRRTLLTIMVSWN